MKLVIDRNTWLRGEGTENSFLLREKDSKMCCLGFLGAACGVPSESMTNTEAPALLNQDHRDLFPDFLFHGGRDLNQDSSDECNSLVEINDDEELTPEEREAELTMLFAKHGIEVEFIN